ncbi:MAG: bifunctional UDP-N-acetylmuramoyl-tripeptide:D-alanyl-D-alanine ligase/alanine racemase [Cyclobacteriaceae bacterium]
MLFSELVNITGGTDHIHLDQEITTYATDTRSLQGKDGEVFVAIKGENRDGNTFIGAAAKLGVKSFIVERIPLDTDINYLLVDNSVAALQKIAAAHRKQFDIPVIGIAGSNGKTTVKEWLFTLLSIQFFVVKSPRSYNSQFGVPLSVLEIRSDHEVGVFEAGISTTNEMRNLRDVIQPTIGIFTTLGAAHDKGFASREEKLSEKLKLFAGSQKVICRSDVEWFDQLQKQVHDPELITWSLSGEARYHVVWNGHEISVGESKYQTSLDHPAELENITHCIVAALEMGISAKKVQEALNSIKSIAMRLELKKGINGCFILDDSYNNDLIGLRVALDHLDSHRQNEKKTLILSDILQTGKSNDELYAEVAELILQKGFTRIIGVGENIATAQGLFKSEKIFFTSTDDLLNNLPEFYNEMILVKGARDYQLERVVSRIEARNHGTVLEVNFEALRHNLNQYRNLLEPKTKMMVMVKANAYGSGILEVSNFLQHEQVEMLGVAYVDEAIQLRQNGIDLPIMIMNPHVSSFSQFERFNLQAEIFSLTHLRRLLSNVRKSISIHIKIDTGMHRLGFSEKEIPELANILTAHSNIKVESIFTHFSSSDSVDEDSFTKEQAELFEKIYSTLCEAIGSNPTKHACNSPAMVRFPQYHYDMVRLGIGLHGFDPTDSLDLRPAALLKTVISQIQELDEGDTVGYSRKGRLTKKSRIAILPLGYEDGYLRVFGNGSSSVLINGSLCPTIGNICMDMMMVDMTGIETNEGDEVVVFGKNPSIKNLAKIAGTIPYEILTNIGGRVKRIFISE